LLIVTANIYSCGNTPGEAPSEIEEDKVAKERLQGTWLNELEGGIVFSVKGDTIYFNDSTSAPASFYVHDDTIVVNTQKKTKYPLKYLDSGSVTFVNLEGDEVTFTKGAEKTDAGMARQTEPISQSEDTKRKRDSVVVCDGKQLHAYTNITPTTHKVYSQSTNSDGLGVETAYYDNIIHIALYEGKTKLFGQNFAKDAFKELVPKEYFDNAILKDIKIAGTHQKAVRFTATLIIPDTYVNFKVNIDIDSQGNKILSI
jgi:hypothetical protein